MSKKNVGVRGAEAIIVLRPDCSFEVSLPEADVLQEGGEHLVTAATLMYVLNHPEVLEALEEEMLSKYEVDECAAKCAALSNTARNMYITPPKKRKIGKEHLRLVMPKKSC